MLAATFIVYEYILYRYCVQLHHTRGGKGHTLVSSVFFCLFPRKATNSVLIHPLLIVLTYAARTSLL